MVKGPPPKPVRLKAGVLLILTDHTAEEHRSTSEIEDGNLARGLEWLTHVE
jgi:hypothetical protein